MKSVINKSFASLSKSPFYFVSSKNLSKQRTVDPFGGEKAIECHPKANPNRLINKYAIVTGGSKGIGKETSNLFAQSGISGLTVSDIDEKLGKQLVDEINSTYNKKVATFIKADVSKEDDVKRLMTQHMQHFGKLNVLVNNAGIMMNEDSGPIDTSLSTWNKTMEVNSTSVFLACKYGLPEMLKSGGGSVVNIASIVAMIGSATAQIAYTASKGAVLAMSKEMAIIHARQGIRINAVCPGPLYTDLLKAWLDTDEKIDRRIVHFPNGRFGHPKEIAQAITFLSSDESSLINASEFVVDGGLTKAYITPL